MVKFNGKNVVRFIIASVILVTGALFVFNKPTNAAPVTYLKVSNMTPEQSVASYAYFYALNNVCKATDTLTSSDSLLSVISNNTKPALVGHIAENYAGSTLGVKVSNDDGKMQCGGIFQAAIKLWTGKSIESLDQATKDDILKKLGYKNEVANRYYCYTKFSGAPNKNYPPLYGYDSTVTSQSLHPFLSLSADGINPDKVTEDVLGFDSFITSGLAPLDIVLNVLTSLGTKNSSVVGTDKYNDFCEKVANQFEGMGANTPYAEKSTTSTATWKLDGGYLIYDFAYANIYENEAPVLDSIGRYYTYFYYYVSKSTEYGCGGVNLGEKDAFLKSIEGSSTTTLSAADKLLWIDNKKYPYDEIIKITTDKGAFTTYSYYQKNSYLTETNTSIELMELQDVDNSKTCHELANLISIESQNISDSINRNYGANPYGAILGLLIADNNMAPVVENNQGVGSGTNESKTTCAVDGIGWLICPITKAMSKLVDGAYVLVSGMLTTPALDTDTSGDATDITQGVVGNSMYAMWKIMRTFANIAFVIAFLIITFSQMTSMGINNYGIKKMLPKLIIAAILVNISYFMCAIAIDISNIVGTGIYDLLSSVNKSAVITTEKPTLDILAGVADFTIGATAASVAVAASGGAWAALTLLVPGLIAALMAIVTVFLVLTLRQALIILLVVISPLALVAYILPNTESWFKKWKDLFVTMLMMFPIISAVFAISKLASSIVVSGSNGHGMVALMGMFIQFIPLAITPLVLKSAGGVLNKFAGMVNNPNRGPFDAMKKGAAGYRNNRKNLRDLNALQGGKGATSKLIRWNTKRKAVNSNRQRLTGDAGSEFLANEAQSDNKFLNRLAGGTNNKQADEQSITRALANALNTKLEIEAKEVRAASAIITNMNLSVPDKQNLAKGLDVTTSSGKVLSGKNNYIRQAAIDGAIKASKVDEVEDIIKSSGSSSPTAMTATQRQVLVNSLISSGFTSKSPNLAGGTLGKIETGEINTDDDLNESVISLIRDGKLSAEKVANSDIAMLKRLSTAMNRPDIETKVGTDRYLSMLTEIETAQTNPTIANTMDTVKKDELHKIVDPTKP